MSKFRCPGQDMQNWKPEDIYIINCPFCKTEIEFFKDEPLLNCHGCKKEVRNPKIDTGCAKWCKHSDKCIDEK